MALLSDLDALRREEPFQAFCETLVALENNNTSANDAADLLHEARRAAQAIKAADFEPKLEALPPARPSVKHK